MASSSRLATPAQSKSLWIRIWSYRYIYLLLLPGFIWLLIFSYYPMYGVQLAFKSFRTSIANSPWVGMANFNFMFRDVEFFIAFRNTVVISAMKLAVNFPIPIILAMLLNEIHQQKFKKFLQTVFTFPHFLSWVIVAAIIQNLLGSTGLVNNVIVSMGGERFMLFRNPQAFRWMLVISESWKGAGWSTIIYLAAIASIDPGQYESATIDGANRFHRLLHVTWPGIRGIASMMFILAIGGLVGGNFDQIFNLYNPAVYSTADILPTYIYRVTFGTGNDFGVATAIGLFNGLINCVLLLIAHRVITKYTDRQLFV